MDSYNDRSWLADTLGKGLIDVGVTSLTLKCPYFAIILSTHLAKPIQYQRLFSPTFQYFIKGSVGLTHIRYQPENCHFYE